METTLGFVQVSLAPAVLPFHNQSSGDTVTYGLLGPYQVGEVAWVSYLCHHVCETFSSQRGRCLLKQGFALVRNIKSFQIVLQVKFGIRKCLG